MRIHGHAENGRTSPVYQSWSSMRTRCLNPRDGHWPAYGGRGIRICDAWSDFRVFLRDVGPRPTRRHTLDRIDVDGDYEPGNVRWATPQEQSRNRRSNVILELDGERATLTAWAERYGMRRSALWLRLSRGWSLRDALTTPLRETRRGKRLSADEVEQLRRRFAEGATLGELANLFGLSKSGVHLIVRGKRRMKTQAG